MRYALQLLFAATVALAGLMGSASYFVPAHKIISAGAIWAGYKDFSEFSKKDPKIKGFQSRVITDLDNIISDSNGEEYQSGAELRKNRNRDLKEVRNTQDKPVVFIDDRTYNKSPEYIEAIIRILNQSYGSKSRDELSEEERVGLIDWDKFDQEAGNVVESYLEGTTRSKIVHWVTFHRKKKDIVFEYDTWAWKGKKN
ncbi:hypothetical protein B484DRAFT_449513 [Ochromonadaceae sp. CCMP2298]|nr:hypothetical protein B484DRAFT_449513 [Ochromonadaceae sp. CCMP2298]